MNADGIPLWLVFIGTILSVMLFMDVGFRLGSYAQRRSIGEKESQISGVSGAVLALGAFILAFAFSIVTDRLDLRKALVREDAGAIRTTWLRAAFLPPADRAESRRLIESYLKERIAIVHGGEVDKPTMDAFRAQATRTQQQLWAIAVANAERDMDSDVAALYVDSINRLTEVHASRMAIGVWARIPVGIWMVLYGLTALGMLSMGYHAAVAESKRSAATLIVAMAFAMVISLIAALDRPWGIASVAQQPLEDVVEMIAAAK